MKFVNFKIPTNREAVLSTVSDFRLVNQKLKSADGEPAPGVTVKKLGENLFRIRCNYIGGPTKDDGFVEGTFFLGFAKNVENGCRMKGIILTEPVFHVIFSVLFVFLLVKSIMASAIPVMPLCLLAFVIFMLRKEYKKQNMLYRYLVRAVKATLG